MRKCPCCGQYIKLSDWPVYKGKPYTYCRSCKRATQRVWVAQKRELDKSKFYELK